jgi:alanine racemase
VLQDKSYTYYSYDKINYWKREKKPNQNIINIFLGSNPLMLRAGFHDKDAVIIFEDVYT